MMFMSEKFTLEESQKLKGISMTTRTMLTCFMWWSKGVGLSLLLMQGAAAASLSLTCPDRYPDRQHVLALNSAGWHAPAGHHAGSALAEAGVLVGPVTETGELRGADLPSGAGRRFNFAGTDADGAKWFYCDYQSADGARLAYQLPAITKRCVTTEKIVRHQLVAASIRCE